MKNSAEKERWEDIAQAAVKKNSGRCKLECEKCDAKFTKIILSAIAESHQRKTEQPEPKTLEKKEEKSATDARTVTAFLKKEFSIFEGTSASEMQVIETQLGYLLEKKETERVTEAGAALLSKESEVAARIRARGIVNEGGMNPHVRMSVRERDSIVSEVASQRDVIEQMRNILNQMTRNEKNLRPYRY